MHAPLAPEKRVLLRAAELLRERGHCKGMLWNDKGEMCAVGALIQARVELQGRNYYDYATDDIVGDAMSLIIQKRPDIDLGSNPNNSLVEWNNESDRIGEEVAAVFEQVALS